MSLSSDSAWSRAAAPACFIRKLERESWRDASAILGVRVGANDKGGSGFRLRFRPTKSGVLEHAALVFADDDAAGIERRLEDTERFSRLRVAAHENIERRVALFGPGMDADVTLREHGDAGDAAAFGEGVQMNMQKRRARRLHRVDQRSFDAVAIVETLGFPQIDDQVTARIGQTVAGDEVVFLLVVVDRRGYDGTNGPRRSPDARRPCFFGRRNKFESSHFGHLP